MTVQSLILSRWRYMAVDMELLDRVAALKYSVPTMYATSPDQAEFMLIDGFVAYHMLGWRWHFRSEMYPTNTEHYKFTADEIVLSPMQGHLEDHKGEGWPWWKILAYFHPVDVTDMNVVAPNFAGFEWRGAVFNDKYLGIPRFCNDLTATWYAMNHMPLQFRAAFNFTLEAQGGKYAAMQPHDAAFFFTRSMLNAVFQTLKPQYNHSQPIYTQ